VHPHLPAWWLPGLRPLPPAAERRLSSAEACGDLDSPPRAGAKTSLFPSACHHAGDVIAQPMDYSTIKGKLARGEYGEDHLAFAADVRLVFQNALKYNYDRTNQRPLQCRGPPPSPEDGAPRRTLAPSVGSGRACTPPSAACAAWGLAAAAAPRLSGRPR
jgi:hypothetical protein